VPTKHFVALDSWRGVCALLVAVFHFPASGILASTPFIKHSNLFVDFFFVLSGFVIAANYFDRIKDVGAIGRFMWLRIGRLYPLHIAILAAFLLIELAKLAGVIPGGEAFAGDRSTDTILTNAFLVHSLGMHADASWNRPSWSISCEMFAYLAFAMATLLGGRKRWIAYGALMLLSLGMLISFSEVYLVSTAKFGAFRALLGFFAGVFCWRAWASLEDRADSLGGSRFWTCVEAAMLVAVVTFVSMTGVSPANFAAPVIFFATVLVFSLERGALSRFAMRPSLTYLGRLSYSLYMIHFLIMTVGLKMFRVLESKMGWDLTHVSSKGLYLFGADGLTSDLLTLPYVALVIIASHFTYEYIEKPGRDFFRSLSPKPKKPDTVALKKARLTSASS